MNAYEAARAAKILGLESLPDRLTVEQIAILQVGNKSLRDEERGIWCKAMRAAIDAGELREADGKIAATDFKRWMHEYGCFSSMLIEGWFSLHARERKAPESMGPHPVADEGLQNGSGGDKPLGKRERDTLLTIIAALCKFAGYDLKERGLAARIAQMTEELGAPVNEDTIRNVLNRIPDALESRMK